jgi:hypothetical protein
VMGGARAAGTNGSGLRSVGWVREAPAVPYGARVSRRDEFRRERDVYTDDLRRSYRAEAAGPGRYGPADPAPARRGPTLTGTGAVLVMAAIAAVAGVVDVVAGDALRLVFSGGLVLGALVAALLVRQRDLLTVIFAPPLVYLVASALAVLLGRGQAGGGLLDVAASWLVYGFPAMAAATGIATLVAGIRVARR